VRQTAKDPVKAGRLKAASQTSSIAVCKPRLMHRSVVERIIWLPSGRAKMPPRKQMAEAPNRAAAPNPVMAARLSPQPDRPGLTVMINTPETAIRIAPSIGQPSVSPSTRNEASATSTGSVFSQAVVTAKLADFIVTSIKAVAPIWAAAPVSAKAKDRVPGMGTASPRMVVKRTRNNKPNGRPNRKRTCVAPRVPIFLVRPDCAALRPT